MMYFQEHAQTNEQKGRQIDRGKDIRNLTYMNLRTTQL